MNKLEVPHQFQNIVGFGKPHSIYNHRNLQKIGNIVGVILGLALGAYLLYEGFVLYPERFPDVASSNSPAIIVVGAIVIVGTLFWVFKLFRKWNEALIVYENGFAYFDGKNVQTFKWTEISIISMHVVQQMVYGIIPAGKSRKYWVHKLSGESIKLDGSLSDPDGFIQIVRDAANPYIYTRVQAMFESDENIDFGVVSIKKSKGIIRKKKVVPWSDIGQISVYQGLMKIEPKTKGTFRKFEFSVAGIPNFDILISLVNKMAEQQKIS